MPYCVNQVGQFDSIVQIERCEGDLKSGVKELNDYSECIRKSIEDRHKELAQALEELDRLRKNLEQKSE